MSRGDRTYTAGTKRDKQDALSCVWGQPRVCSPTVHRAAITLNETNIWGLWRVELLLPQCLQPWKTLPLQGRAAQKENTNQLERIQSGNPGTALARRHRLHTEENLLYGRAQNSPPLLPPVFGNLRGTPHRCSSSQKQGNPQGKGSIPSQRKHSAFRTSVVSWACPALLSQPRGIWNSLRTTLGYCTWQSVGSYKTAPSQIQGFLPNSSEPPLPSSTASICPRGAR